MTISIITCSIKPNLCKKMLTSMRKTIGVDFEEIVFDNREYNYGICKVYNEAAKKSKGNYLCFVHEDIVFETNNWGKELTDFAEKTNNCGAISIAGGSGYSCKNFSGWWLCSTKFFKFFHNENKISSDCINDLTYCYSNPYNELFSKTIYLDGVFLFVKKDIWLNNIFDEATFKGFHFYDADFSFSISQKYQNYVYFGMNLYHFSSGSRNMAYCENMYLFQMKWVKNSNFYFGEFIQAYKVYNLYRKNNYPIIECLFKINKINGILFISIFLFFLIFFKSFGVLKKSLKTFFE